MIPPGVHEAKPGSPKPIAPKGLIVTATTSLFRRDGLERRPLIEVRAYGVLQRDAVHRQADKPRLDARLRTTRPLHPYVTEAGSSPTSTVARQGVTPTRRASSAALPDVSSTMRRASALHPAPTAGR